jgi:predicted nucleic acid-binding protein
VIYLDSSAIVKLARREAESQALRTWLAEHPQPIVASSLARTETARALMRSEPTALVTLQSVLSLLIQKPLTDGVLDAAAALPGTTLRSLDALHLATAEALLPTLRWFVAYDKRLADAARDRGLPVAVPS